MLDPAALVNVPAPQGQIRLRTQIGNPSQPLSFIKCNNHSYTYIQLPTTTYYLTTVRGLELYYDGRYPVIVTSGNVEANLNISLYGASSGTTNR